MIAILKLMTTILGFKVDKSSGCPVPDFCAFIYIDIYSMGKRNLRKPNLKEFTYFFR